jgi:galactokinase
MATSSLINTLHQNFTDRFGAPPDLVVRAPGRVNLIGEHTDYNDGFVLPVAIDRAVFLAASPRDDRRVVLHALDLDATDEFDLDAITRAAAGYWSNYQRGVAAVLQSQGYDLVGLNVALTSTVPVGAGLSSSAAVELAIAWAWRELAGLPIERAALALACQRAEHEYPGTQCGIMDQFISALGQRDHALLIDCRSLDYQQVPLPDSTSPMEMLTYENQNVRIVVSDSGVRRELATSAYNERRAQCEQAVELLSAHLPGITALRDVTVENLKAHAGGLPEVVGRRARHIVTENARTLEGVAALTSGDLVRFGELMKASHHSLRDDYEVSCVELDTLVEAAWTVEGCYGSRLTGAGFGGCTVSLVDNAAIETFRGAVSDAYRREYDRTPAIYVCTAEDGVGRV